MNFILENILGLFALLIMITSLGLQISYIRFKKKSYPATAQIKEIIRRKFFNVLRIKISDEHKSYEATIFKFKTENNPGDQIEVMYNPFSIHEEDKSIVMSRILKKLNVYYFDKPIVYYKDQNPLFFYIGLLLLGFLIALLA